MHCHGLREIPADGKCLCQIGLLNGPPWLFESSTFPQEETQLSTGEECCSENVFVCVSVNPSPELFDFARWSCLSNEIYP